MKEGQVVDALAQLSWHVQSRMTDAGAAHGVSLPQLRLLGILRDRQPEMLELAEHLHLDKSSVTGLVSRAEARGLVERITSDVDRRKVSVRLTEAGVTLAQQLEREITAALSVAIGALSPTEQRTLVGLVSTMVPVQ